MKYLIKAFSFFFIFIAIFIFSQESFENKIKENEQKLTDIRNQLKLVKSRKDSIDIQRTRTLYMLNRMDEEIYLTDVLIKQLKMQDSLLSLRINNLSIEIDSLEIETSKRKNMLKNRLNDIYKKGKVHTFEIVFTAKSFSDLTQRIRYLATLAKQDRNLYNKVKNAQNILQKRIEEINLSKEQLKMVNDEAEMEKSKLINEKGNKERFLQELYGEQKKQKDLEDELKKSEESLQYLVNKLRVAHKQVTQKRDVEQGKHYFDTNKKKIIWPARGNIISKFGTVRHPKYKTETLNNGIDIKVQTGDPVYAVYDGDVIYADKFLGYGNVVMLDHGNGYYTLYAHLSQIDVILNQPVATGEIIARCGETGSLSGPILHFEIRKDGKPLNPLNYLK